MKIKILATILAIGFIATDNAQRRTVAPKPSATPSPQAKPEPTASQPATQPPTQPDELSAAEREDIEKQMKQVELKIGLNDLFAMNPNSTVTERATRDRETADAMEQLAQLYGKAARDNGLMQEFIASAFRLSFDKPAQANLRLLSIQAAQNQLLIEQNQKIIQLLERTRK